MLEEIVPLDPVAFFAFQIDCFKIDGERLTKKHLLPDLSPFHNQMSFAHLSLGWHESGIFIAASIKGSFRRSSFPQLMNGDAIELFFDTRDIKTTGFTTRFCHHFFFLPEPVQNEDDVVQAGELTRFRNEDVHERCDPQCLQISTTHEKKITEIQIFIPSECLHGYDPTQFDRLGFTYRIHRADGTKQNFSASDADFSIESQPSLWASLKLVKS